MGTDFVVAEECNRYDECDVYTGAYGDAVLVIEYRQGRLHRRLRELPAAVDRAARSRPGAPGLRVGYVFDGC
jgi:hypothetical protein